MAFKQVKAAPSELFTLDIKAKSKLLHTLPAVSDAKSMEEMAPKSAYWPIYTCVQHQLAQIDDVGDQLIQLVTRNYDNAEMRKGFVHTEIGRAVAEMWTTTPQPGEVLAYKVHEFIRLFEECIDEDPVKLRVGINTKSFQYIEGFTEAEHYGMVMDRISTAASVAIKDAMKTFIYSLFVNENQKGFVKNFYLERLWASNLKLTDETESKSYKSFYDSNGDFYKLCKKAAGEFQTKFKNKRYFDPAYYSTWDFKRDGDYKVEKLNPVSSADDLKTKITERYSFGTTNETQKKKPPKWITRDQCIYAMIDQIQQAVSDLTRIPSIENCLEYDPYATAQATDKQLPCRATKEELVVFMNPHDLEACRRGAGYAGPGGATYGIRSINDLGVTLIPVDGMMPGDAYVMDKRVVNVFPYYQATFRHMNTWHLVDQTEMHFQFKWGVFRYFAGIQVIATRWCPDAAWISEFAPTYAS